MKTSYQFTKEVSVIQLENEIRSSAIATALDSISLDGSVSLIIWFKDAISQVDEAILEAVVSAHVPVAIIDAPTEVKITSQPEPLPFAQPTFRTKRDGCGFISCPENATTNLDFQLTAERYVSGGQVILKDVQEGDFLSAEVYDKDGLIPVPYRDALCEYHPCVAIYIIKHYLKPCTGFEAVDIDTYPLNAKISAGLYLRLSMHTTAAVGERKMAVNYHLTKRL